MKLLLYTDYLDLRKSLTFEESMKLHGELLSEIGSDETAVEIYTEICEKAARYSGLRSKWLIMSKEEKADADPSRTFCHDSLIICINKLTRYLRMNEKTAAWRDELGNELFNGG